MLPNSVSDFNPEKYLTRKDEKTRKNAMRIGKKTK